MILGLFHSSPSSSYVALLQTTSIAFSLPYTLEIYVLHFQHLLCPGVAYRAAPLGCTCTYAAYLSEARLTFRFERNEVSICSVILRSIAVAYWASVRLSRATPAEPAISPGTSRDSACAKVCGRAQLKLAFSSLRRLTLMKVSSREHTWAVHLQRTAVAT